MRRCRWTLVMIVMAALAARAERGGTRHRDPQLGFSLDLPSRWSVAASDVPGLVRFQGDGCAPDEPPVRCGAYVVLMRGTAQEGETSEAAYRRRMRPWKMRTEGRLVVDRETVPWGDMDYGGGTGDPPMRLFTVVLVRDGRWFEFTGWSRPESYSKARPVFEEMVRSLAFP